MAIDEGEICLSYHSLSRGVTDRPVMLHQLHFEGYMQKRESEVFNEATTTNVPSGVSHRPAASELRGDALLGSIRIWSMYGQSPKRSETVPPRRDCKDKRIVWTLYTADHLS